ncbi:MAG: PAS domain S-box protein [Planctomycetes bacterium]|nr:PAS domain S-box protein [Planctomycetota bacterium]
MNDLPDPPQACQRCFMAARDVDELLLLAQVAERTNSAVLVADTQRYATWVNAAFTRMTGYTIEDLAGRRPEALLTSDRTDQAVLERLRLALEALRPIRVEALACAKGGREFWADVDVQPLFDAEGAHTGFLGILTDVTEQVNMRSAVAHSEERLRLALTGAGIGTWDWNVATGEVWFDERWCSMLGYRIDEIEPHVSSWERLVHPSDLARAMQAIQAHFAGATAVYECDHRLKSKSGAWVWIHDVGRVLERDASGAPLRMSGVHIDVSATKSIEAERTFAAELHRTISSIQQRFIEAQHSRDVFDGVLGDVLSLAGGQCGFIGESEARSDGTPFLRTHAVRGFAWNGELGGFRETTPAKRPVFSGMQGQVESALRSGKTVLSPATHEDRAPHMVVPLSSAGVCIGAIGIADLDAGYDATAASRLQPAFDAIGQILGAWRDAQARSLVEAKLRESEERHRLIVDTALDAVVSMDARGVITAWNRQAETMFGWSAQEAVGRPLAETIIPYGKRDAHRLGLANYLSQRFGPLLNSRLETVALRRGGEEFPVELSIAPLHRAGTVSFTAFLRDITERRAAQLELRRHRDHLEELVLEQTQSLREALERAEVADRTKGEFLANMSHELRTPMHAILSFARRGESKSHEAAQEKLERYFEAIRVSGSRLLLLLNDLLDLSKLESGRMRFEMRRHDLRAIVESAIDEFRALALERRVTLSLAPTSADTRVPCDEVRMLQVVRNLLSNAIKFSPLESAIRLEFAEASLSTADGGARAALALHVTDEGCGIPDAERAAIFEKFVQSSQTTSGAGGTGLGLAICREIVNAHQGTIEAVNNPGRGATFTLLLPRERAPQPGPALPAPPATTDEVRT